MEKFTFSIKKLNKLDRYKKINFWDIVVTTVSTFKNPKSNSIIFVLQGTDESLKNLEEVHNCLILFKKDGTFEKKENISKNNFFYFCDNPKYEYSFILNYILKQKVANISNYNNVCIHENSKIGKGTFIEPFVYIEDNVEIGENCIIKTGVKILKNTKIGNNCIIRENSVISGQGFGVCKDDDNNNYKIPQIGGVIVGNNVEIGALCTIVSGTIEPTIIGDYVKTDDHVHIAHNCLIGKNNIITACVEFSGSITTGDNVWVGPNASLINKISIGNNVFIGIGAVVTKSIPDAETWVGNPAKNINLLKTK